MTALSGDLDVDGDQTTISIAGDLDIASAPDVLALAKAATDRTGMRVLVLDLGGVDFIDSVGVGVLIQTRHLCATHDAELHLRAVGPRVRKILEITNLTQTFGLPKNDGGHR